MVSDLKSCLRSFRAFCHTKSIFRKPVNNSSSGIKINGTGTNNLTYAGDTMVLASGSRELCRWWIEL